MKRRLRRRNQKLILGTGWQGGDPTIQNDFLSYLIVMRWFSWRRPVAISSESSDRVGWLTRSLCPDSKISNETWHSARNFQPRFSCQKINLVWQSDAGNIQQDKGLNTGFPTIIHCIRVSICYITFSRHLILILLWWETCRFSEMYETSSYICNYYSQEDNWM